MVQFSAIGFVVRSAKRSGALELRTDSDGGENEPISRGR
jgi:hypothetical protein